MKYQEQYTHVKSVIRKLGGECQDMMEHFSNLHKSSVQEGAIPNKYKELIALGISISIQCNECIVYHLNDAINAGATDEEIMETISVSVMMGGGPALIYATHAYEALQELKNGK
ncbi:MAG: carboxymuconolactone decarboxylase family protein [Saprospiraceae bacterium]|nr:carboxymuconolactone decarboxylase family protein [Saprospiraceae bacterium]